MKGKTFEPRDWLGDPVELLPYWEQIAGDAELCELLFASKHEAFNAGIYVEAESRDEREEPA